MDNSGFGSGTTTATYTNAGTYLDWSITTSSNSANAYTYTEHFVVTPNDPGFHIYFVARHASTDIAGSIGQVQWVFRDNLNQFVDTYEVDPSVNSPGATIVPLPPASENFSTDPGSRRVRRHGRSSRLHPARRFHPRDLHEIRLRRL